MNDLHISCIIPVFNAQRYLSEAIDSVLAQTFAPQQLIVVDDGSTDGSADIARSYGKRIELVQQENLGVSQARNHGLRLARCPWITFLDADDLYEPQKLARQMQQIAARPELDMSLVQVQNFWSSEIPADQRGDTDPAPAQVPGQVASWLIRRDVLHREGGFSTDRSMCLAEGSDLFLRIRETGAAIEGIAEPLVKRRLHAANSVRDRQKHLDSILMLMKQQAARRKAAS